MTETAEAPVLQNMNFAIPPLEIEEDKGFADDLFNLEKFGEGLTSILRISNDDHLVIGLDGKWGQGKTTFVKKWADSIKEEYKTIYFDAYAHDYQAEPFIALASEIYRFIEDKVKDQSSSEKEEFLKKFGKQAVRVATVISKQVIKSRLQVDVKEMVDELTDIKKKALNSMVYNQMVGARKLQEGIEQFKKTLTEMQVKTGNKLVIIIDELDRCRPDFALELLEKIKHVFSTQGIVFLLVMNKDQLSKMINLKYGDIDANLFLQKFIHFELPLPYKEVTAKTYIEHLKNLWKGTDNLELDTLTALLSTNKSSLREIERCFVFFCILRSRGRVEPMVDRLDIEKILVEILIFCKILKRDLFEKLKREEIDIKSTLKEIYPRVLELYDALEGKNWRVKGYNLHLSDLSYQDCRELDRWILMAIVYISLSEEERFSIREAYPMMLYSKLLNAIAVCEEFDI